MAKRVLGWFGLALVCAISGGCKSAGEDDAGPISEDQLPSELAKVVCDSFGSCCSAAHYLFDATNCGGSEASDLNRRLGLPAPAAVHYDAQAAGDCVAQLKSSIHCGDINAASDIPACNRILVGTLAIGQPCTDSNACKSPGYCQLGLSATGQEEGICTAPGSGDGSVMLVRGGTGTACSVSCYSEGDCQSFIPPLPVGGDPSQPPPGQAVACYRTDGLYCGGGGTCQSLGGLGADCTEPDGCKDGLFCDGLASRCTAPHPNGASCNGDGECQSQSCSQDTNTCASTSVTAMQCANGTP